VPDEYKNLSSQITRVCMTYKII